MGMVLYGMNNTRTVSDLMMINHASAVKKAASKSLVFFDLPFRKKFNESEIINRVIKIKNLTKCDGVKIEGNLELIDIIKYLTKKNIPVIFKETKIVKKKSIFLKLYFFSKFE